MKSSQNKNLKQISCIHLKPLTRRNGGGDLYTRLPEVEKQIKLTLQLDKTSIRALISIENCDSEKFLKEECLVYMIRHFHSCGDQEMVSEIFKVLMSRCAKFTQNHLKSLGQRAEDAFSEIITNLVKQILNLESDRSDFYQVRFWYALKRLILSEYKKQTKLFEKDEKNISLSGMAEDHNNYGVEVDILDESLSQEEIVMCEEGLNILVHPHREVFILRYYYGWPIESDDPNKETLSTHFKVTPRTIRNWLSDARAILKKWGKGDRS